MADPEGNEHAISLVDSTQPPASERSTTTDSVSQAPQPTRNNTNNSLRNSLGRGGNLREEWTRRKYARYQESRYAEEGEQSSTDEQQGEESTQKGKKREHGRLRDRVPFRSKKPKQARKHEESAVDILYENQRGSFFCGIPLYSSASLLNFDPSPWQTATFTDSPVNITNAQVPDPTWAWTWKRWYVDMSHDVDEEGWEYSFSFNKNFSWHGAHPFFYSFVRRRRWLRKRVRIRPRGPAATRGINATLDEAHQLTSEYFTIHAAPRDSSRESSLARGSQVRSSMIAPLAEHDSASEVEDVDIDNIAALLKRLKHTTIDRKKADAFRLFLANAGNEILSLPEYMAEIMNLFMYQSSRRQILADLHSALENLRASTDDSSKGPAKGAKRPQQLQQRSSSTQRPPSTRSRSFSPGDGKTRQLAALRAAIDAIPSTIHELEYWSDAKGLADPIEGLDFTTGDTTVVPALPIGKRVRGKGDESDVKNTISPTREDVGIGARIKGIPQAAGLDEDVGLVGRLGSGNKGKDKEPREVCTEHDT